MQSISKLIDAISDGVRIAEACHGRSSRELVQFGVPDALAGQLADLGEAYYGDTAYKGLQRKTVTNAARNGHSLSTLLAVEVYTKRLKKQRFKWELRAHALSQRGTTNEVKKAARLRVKELKGPTKPPEPGTRITRRKSGIWTFSIHAKSEEAAEIHQHIKEPSDLLDLIHRNQILEAGAVAGSAPWVGTPTDTAVPYPRCSLDDAPSSPAPSPDCTVVDAPGPTAPSSESPIGDVPSPTAPSAGRTAEETALPNPLPKVAPTKHVTCASCGATTEATQIVSGLRTNIIIPLDDMVRLVDGDGDECVLRMTNGATMTGKEFVTRKLADIGLITLVDPVRGAINLYRTSRLASMKQRLMAMAENPVCPWPDCNHPADTAEIHHLRSWKRGGNTNPENLSVLCAYHNGVNDDDPKNTRRGHMARVRGVVRYIPPWATYHPAA